jgi:hypothetical protein
LSRPVEAARGDWDLGRIEVERVARLAVSVTLDADGASPDSGWRGARVDCWLRPKSIAGVLGITPQERDHLERNSVLLDFEVTAQTETREQVTWVPYDEIVSASFSWRNEYTRNRFVIGVAESLPQLDHREPLRFAVAARDLVFGRVMLADLTPAPGSVVRVLGDGLFPRSITGGAVATDPLGRFAVAVPGASGGDAMATLGNLSISGRYVVGQELRLTLPALLDNVVRVRIVDDNRHPVERAAFRSINEARREGGRCVMDADFLRRATVPVADGVLMLGVAGIPRGERWFVTTSAGLEAAYVFPEDVHGGVLVDVPAKGNQQAVPAAALDLVGADVGDSEVMIEEVVPKGRIPVRYRTTFSGTPSVTPLVIEHVYPGTYRVEVLRRNAPAPRTWRVAEQGR